MTDQSPTIIMEASTDQRSKGIVSEPVAKLQRPHKPWLLYVLIILLGASTIINHWKLFRLERKTQQLESKSNKLSTRLNALADSSSHSSTPPLAASTPQSIPTPPLSPETAATPIPAASLNTAITPPTLISSSLSRLNNNPSAPPLPSWIYRSFVTTAAIFVEEGHWEAAINLLAKVQLENTSTATQSELALLRQGLESQKNLLKLMRQQLQQLEDWVPSLPLKKSSPRPTFLEASPDKDIGSRLRNEIVQDISLLLRIEPSDAEMIRQRNSAAFESKNQLTQALRYYHNAWRKGDLSEQDSLRHYIHTLLDYGFDMDAETTKTFLSHLESWLQHPHPVRPAFPSFVSEGAL